MRRRLSSAPRSRAPEQRAIGDRDGDGDRDDGRDRGPGTGDRDGDGDKDGGGDRDGDEEPGTRSLARGAGRGRRRQLSRRRRVPMITLSAASSDAHYQSPLVALPDVVVLVVVTVVVCTVAVEGPP